MNKGYEYWKKTFFLSDGTPRYYDHKTLPIDIQCCFAGDRHAGAFSRTDDPESFDSGAQSRPMDDQAHAGQNRLFLLPPVFWMGGEQNSNSALGTSDDVLRSRGALSRSLGDRLRHYVNRKVLIIVENLPVPFDTRVWKEALALREPAIKSRYCVPMGKGYERGYELVDGIHIYRHPIPQRARRNRIHLGVRLGFVLGVSLFFVDLLAHGFQVIQGCNPPDDIFLVALPLSSSASSTSSIITMFVRSYIFLNTDEETYFTKSSCG